MGKEGRTVYLFVDLYLPGWQRLILEREDSTIQLCLTPELITAEKKNASESVL